MTKIFLLIPVSCSLVSFVSCSETFNAARPLQGTMKAVSTASTTDAHMQSYVHQYVVKLDLLFTQNIQERPFLDFLWLFVLKAQGQRLSGQ